MKRNTVAIALILVIALTCFASGTALAEGSITLKIAFAESAQNLKAECMAMFAKNVEERTNGAVKFELYPNNELGSLPDVLEQVAMGANVIASTSLDALADYGSPDWTAPTIFYALATPEELLRFRDSELCAELTATIEENGLKLLNMYAGQPRQLLSTHPVQTYDDLKGLKIRVPTAVFAAFFEAAGCATMSTGWNEVYTGLSTGILEAAEAPLNTLYDSSLYEVAKYCTLTSHTLSPACEVMSKNIYDMLGDNAQIVFEESRKASEWYIAQAQAAGDAYRAKLEEKGVTFYEFSAEDFAKMRETSQAVYAQFPQMSPDINERVQAAIAE